MVQTSGTEGRRIDLVTTAVLAAAGVALLFRIVSIVEPLGIDQGLWASAVRGMARGQRLYADVWEQRPPGIYFTYLLGFTIFGWTSAAVAWMDIVAATIVTSALFVVGKRLDGPRTGAFAALLYAAFTNPAGLSNYGGFLERSICETFIVACVAIGAVCAARLRERASMLAAIGLGLCGGVAVIYKPNAGLYFPALLIWLAFYGRRADWWRTALVATAASIVPIAGTIAWLAMQGTLHDAKVAVIDFNRYYVAEGFELFAYIDLLSHRLFGLMKTDAIWAAGSVAAVFAIWTFTRARALPPLAGLAICWGAATFGVIVVNGVRLFPSYFWQALAPLTLLAAWLLTSATVKVTLASRVFRMIAIAATAVVLARSPFLTRAVEWSSADYAALTGVLDHSAHLNRFGTYGQDRGFSALANDQIAEYVRVRTQPDERVFLFGVNGASLYFLADRLTAHRFLRVNFFAGTDFPDPSFRLDAVVRDLTARRPRYLLFEDLHQSSAIGRSVSGVVNDPAVLRLLEGYALETTIEDFAIYRRRD